MQQIILASSSVYRQEQLRRLKVDFTAIKPDVDEEPFKHQGLDHTQLSIELALLKARAISQNTPEAIVIGGDQVASLGDQTLSKPGTRQKAFEQLKQLSGREHSLITSLAIVHGREEHLHTCVARMKMRQLSDQQISRYIEQDEPLQSCGSYKLETLGISLFESIDCEDYTSIIGIPLMWTAKTLTSMGVSVP
jgi:septum formation protein